jgi:8-oxo-dGTP pyrophosphatase MutT (NUDIX family)
VTLDELAALTRQRLAARARRVVPPGPLVRAAVLVPLIDRGEPYLVFAKRTDTVGTHRGQIGFPGGTVDPEDASLLEAALRECEEEIGLPRAVVEPLGALDDTETFATNFVITPWVGVIREPVAWRPDGEEIERVIEVPFAVPGAGRAGWAQGRAVGARRRTASRLLLRLQRRHDLGSHRADRQALPRPLRRRAVSGGGNVATPRRLR